MAQTAFILLDIQTGIVERIQNVMNTDEYLAKVSSTLAGARKAGIPVVQVTSKYLLSQGRGFAVWVMETV